MFSVFTKDISRAMRFAKGLEAGQVGVNTVGMSDPNLGFGGWKASGLGRELGEHGVFIPSLKLSKMSLNCIPS